MKGRTLAAFGLRALIFVVFSSPLAAFGASQVVQGKITEVIPCTSPAGFVISIASSTEKYILKTGTTTLLPQNATPAAGQSAFVTIGATTTCQTRVGASVTTATGLLIAYLSLPDLGTTPPPPPGGTGGGQTGGGGSSGNSIADRIQSIFQSIFGGGQGSTGGNTNVSVSVSVQTGGGSGSSGGVSPTNLGGMITVMLPCDPAESVPTGTLFQVTVVGPLGGNYAYGPYTKDYQCGPLAPGKNIVGSYTPGAICDLCLDPETYCPSPQLGWINRMPGDGNSGCAAPAKDCTPSKPLPPAKGNICKNPQYDQYIRDALTRCGSNMLNGTIPGIEQYCPNFNKFSPEQKKEFWVRFADALMIRESGCRANTSALEPGGNASRPTSWSEGLFQLSCTNQSSCSGACTGINRQCTNEYISGDPTTKKDRENSGRPILDAKNNIDCAMAIMNDKSRNGITNKVNGIASYWGPLQDGRSTQAAILAEAGAFPGCADGTTPAQPPTTSGDCAQGPVVPPTGQCPQQGQTITPQNKAQMELSVRQALSQCKCTNASCASNTRGISVTSSQTAGGACGYKQDGVAGGCTDVSGLTCGSMSELCSLANACGGFTIGGGSECGHSGDCTSGMHGSGNAVDINHSASLDSCIKSRFQQIRCPASITRSNTDQCWRNPATGAIYWAEPAVGRQGAHWHTCFNGYCR